MVGVCPHGASRRQCEMCDAAGQVDDLKYEVGVLRVALSAIHGVMERDTTEKSVAIEVEQIIGTALSDRRWV